MSNSKHNSRTYPSDSQSGYFIKSSSSYEKTKITKDYSEQIENNIIDDKYYKKSILKKRVVVHVSE